MAVSASFRAYVLEQLERIPHVTSKSMFGGVGVYSEEFFFALLDNDGIYLKVDDTNRPDFEAAEMGAFEPYGDGRTMQYYEVPVGVLEGADELQKWALKAIEVARSSKKGKKKK
ncbi:MAG: TfoX/Sxy family protein [Bacteroidetes bacterium]|nr:TfoX/Sxy family protein [Bacteroidota bacterium]